MENQNMNGLFDGMGEEDLKGFSFFKECLENDTAFSRFVFNGMEIYRTDELKPTFYYGDVDEKSKQFCYWDNAESISNLYPLDDEYLEDVEKLDFFDRRTGGYGFRLAEVIIDKENDKHIIYNLIHTDKKIYFLLDSDDMQYLDMETEGKFIALNLPPNHIINPHKLKVDEKHNLTVIQISEVA